jgi:hypothetical protein
VTLSERTPVLDRGTIDQHPLNLPGIGVPDVPGEPVSTKHVLRNLDDDAVGIEGDIVAIPRKPLQAGSARRQDLHRVRRIRRLAGLPTSPRGDPRRLFD